MAEIRIDEELLLRAGLGIGYAFAPFFRGLLQGVEDYEVESAAREIQEENDAIAEMRKKEHRQKTEISDCRKCWCDQCARLEECPQSRDGEEPDGIRPFPCIGCGDGMRFKPCEEAKCENFIQGLGYNNGYMKKEASGASSRTLLPFTLPQRSYST